MKHPKQMWKAQLQPVKSGSREASFQIEKESAKVKKARS
uniref:Uncharacterized protein n=1 Tax=Manihot esculenta TaxID=3983 RepID=A0A2C9VI39_MANES